jgi:hypothetical protein
LSVVSQVALAKSLVTFGERGMIFVGVKASSGVDWG